MEFRYTINPKLPVLAWCLEISKGSALIEVECGKQVETSDRFFFEGAWDSEDFDAGQFTSAPVCLGSGARIDDTRLILATPSHTLEKVYLSHQGERILASNSFVFLLAKTGDDIDMSYPFYVYDFLKHMEGIRRLGTSTPCQRGKVEMYWCATISIETSLRVRLKRRVGTPEFASYEDYLDYLKAIVVRLQANCASSSRRRQRYEPLSTVSGGYDSPACSVLAKAVGCTAAVTFPKARTGWESDDDDGTPIANLLGLKVHAFDRLAYMTAEDFPEAEFAATGGGGDEVIFASAADDIQGKMLFTGYLGDTVWGMNHRSMNDFMRMLWPGGSSFGEFRIRVGFIHLPVPMITYRSHRSLIAISNARTMSSWSIGGLYDRPIARRLVEEAGVPRKFFGNTKMAVAQSLVDIGSIPNLSEVMSAKSHADFRVFMSQVVPQRGVRKGWFKAMRALYKAHLRIIWRLESIAGRYQLAYIPQPWISKRYADWPQPTLYTFHWGARKLLHRYRVALEWKREACALDHGTVAIG